MAQLHIQSGKAQQAREVLDIILNHNAGSWRAMELKGITFELDKDMKNALIMYQQGWEASCKNNPAIGFRLVLLHVLYICGRQK